MLAEHPPSCESSRVEVTEWLLDADFARQVEQTFLNDLKQAKEIKLDEWRKRGVWERIKERFWVAFAEQY